MLVRAWGRTFGIKYTISNCSNNYGHTVVQVSQLRSLSQGRLLNAILGDSIKVYGTGEEVRDWIHIKDHVQEYLQL